MERIKDFAKKIGISVLSFVLPLWARAQANPTIPTGNSGVPKPNITSVQDLMDLLCSAFGWMFYLLIALAVVFVVIGAYKYLTSSGEAEKVKGANKTLLYAAIAVAIALLAKGIPLIVGDFLGVSAGGSLLAC